MSAQIANIALLVLILSLLFGGLSATALLIAAGLFALSFWIMLMQMISGRSPR